MLGLSQDALAYDVCIDDNHCTHEEMAGFAGHVYTANSDDPEFNINQVVEGAGHEDEVDHIYGWNTSPIPGAVTFTHFWDADSGRNAQSDVDGPASFFGPFPNSWQKVDQYWSLALGQFTNGNLDGSCTGDENEGCGAYHFLGHIAHQMGDNTIPTHVHVSAHDPISGDDSFEDWMSQGASHSVFPDQPPGSDITTMELVELSQATYVPASGGHDPLIFADLNVDIPEVPGAVETSLDKLYWLLYTTNQIADFFPSDRAGGDLVDPEGWVQTELTNMASISTPRVPEDLENNDCVGVICIGGTADDYDNNHFDDDLGVIREHSYLRGIRAIAGLYQLFDQTVSTAPIVVVTIERVEELVGCSIINEDCDFYSRVSIDDFTGVNEGDECFDCIDQFGNNFFPNWAWGKVVATSGSIPIKIEILDDDNLFSDGLVKITDTSSDQTSLKITVDLAKCLSGEAGAITGNGIPGGVGMCNQSIITNATEDTEDVDDQGIARVTFSITMSNVPPIADANGPYEGPEGTDIVLDGTGSTDPNGDPITFEWDFDEDGFFDDATGATPTYTNVGDNKVVTIKLKVTDDHGASDVDETTLTLNNVTPTIDSLSADDPMDEGQTFTVDGTASDPGWEDDLSATIDWDDGFGVQNIAGGVQENVRPDATLIFSDSLLYGDDGVFNTEVCVEDDDGGEDCNDLDIIVNNVAPTAVIDESSTIMINGMTVFFATIGEDIDFSGNSMDPGSDDLTISWDWDDGAPSPDVTTVYLVNDPALDPDKSPTDQPRDVTDDQTHAFVDACLYEIALTSDDDDGGHGEVSATVIIVGDAELARSAGYWQQQVKFTQQNKKVADFDSDTLLCYLDITKSLSTILDEEENLSSLQDAKSILKVGKKTTTHEQLLRQILAGWLNFANGTIGPDELVDIDGDTIPDTETFNDVISEAETVFLNPGSTKPELSEQIAIMDSVNNMDLAD